MQRGLILLLFGLILTLPALASERAQRPIKPEPAVGDFASVNYPMTFQPPAHAFFCPLPPGWEGSDHGTTVFLTPPKSCYGAGFPSSSRGFELGDVPRIDVYYGYDVGSDASKPSPCRSIGTATLLGKSVPLCRETRDGMTTVTVEGRYTADITVDLSISLVSRPGDVDRWLPVFRTMLTTVHSCTSMWDEDLPHGKKKHAAFGHGAPCPVGKWF